MSALALFYLLALLGAALFIAGTYLVGGFGISLLVGGIALILAASMIAKGIRLG